ncbi:MAG: hypothetical protein Ct9H300mP11_25180 [Chloroflexota bacterium]|nr:MAG: hypothetical protein Ct9H300mP11_25180 [Chloroflexota bacterium]
MTVTGKIQKFKMREQAIDELGLHKAAGKRRPKYYLGPLIPYV